MRVPYKASVTKAETAWARHLDEVMRKNDWSRVRLFEEVGPELGYRPKSRTAILPLLGKREPTKAQAAVLRKHFGDPQPIAESELKSEPTLAAALIELAAELREIRLEREAWTRGVAEVLRSYEDGQVPEALLDALVPRRHANAQQ